MTVRVRAVPPARGRMPRQCGTCRFYQPSPVVGRGWCTHPVLRGPNLRPLVDADSLACDRGLYDFWEPAPDRGRLRWAGFPLPAALLRLALVVVPAVAVILFGLYLELTSAPRPAAPATPEPTVVIPTPTPEFYRGWLAVANTGGLGVYVRADPAADAQRIRAWPERTRLEALGEEVEAGGRRWVRVRDPAGNIGWVPAEYVEQVGP